MSYFRKLIKNKKALIGICMLVFFIVIGIFAPIISPHSPIDIEFEARLRPNMQNLLGTDNIGRDIFSQLIWGTRITLLVGLGTSLLVTLVALLIGMTAGYLRGIWDEVLSTLINIFLALPVIPLILVIASFVTRKGILSIILVITLISWAFSARLFRSQVLTLRSREYVMASRIIGESNLYIIFKDIFPNMLSLVFACYFNTALFAVLAEAAIEFIGLGNVNIISWGTMMYWAYNSQVAVTGKWEWLLVPGFFIGLLGVSFSLINSGIDEITSSKLI